MQGADADFFEKHGVLGARASVLDFAARRRQLRSYSAKQPGPSGVECEDS